MEQPSYYSILTADVRYDPRLKKYADCKILFSEITALSNKFGYCKASNKYFAQLYDRPIPTISKWINILKGLGYLKIEMIYKENSNQILERRMFPISTPINAGVNTYSRTHEEGIHVDVKTPINADVKDNNININTTSKNKDNNNHAFLESEELADRQGAIEVLETIHAAPNAYQRKSFLEAKDNYGEEFLKAVALVVAQTGGNVSYRYFEKALSNYIKKGITTPDGVRKEVERHGKLVDDFQSRKEEYLKNGYRTGQTNYQATGAVDFLDPRRLDEM